MPDCLSCIWKYVFIMALMLGAGECERTQVAHEGAQEIFQGVWYTVEEMPGSNETEGAVHLVRVDVQSEEIELFATPVADTSATGAPRYPLRLTSLVARREGLAVAINGSLFERPRWGYWPGAMVRGLHTVVSDGEPSHVHPHSYLLWMDSDRQLHVERSKPPSPDALEAAVWCIGGGEVVLRDGAPRPGTSTEPDRRTMLAIDAEGRYLFMAVFAHASFRAAAAFLAEQGADTGIMLDGGGSTAMHIGRDAAGVGGTTVGGWRPVATHVGVRAHSISGDTR